ncbi:MAG: hypothetical protein ABIH83_02040 [Candidatus Micrarchaeota archaeon]
MFQKLRPLENEELVLRDQGLFQQMVSWKPGYLHLTTRRLIFAQGEKVTFQRYLEDLEKVDIVKRKCILSKMVKQLQIVSGGRVNYIAIRKVDNWLSEIYQTFFELDLDGIER